jgi:hypothetical protein
MLWLQISTAFRSAYMRLERVTLPFVGTCTVLLHVRTAFRSAEMVWLHVTTALRRGCIVLCVY